MRRGNRRFGLTLVELLVVIGIVAVLIAVLMPVLNKARESALRTKCASQLRQLSMAFNMYLGENKNSSRPTHWNYSGLNCNNVIYDGHINPRSDIGVGALARYLNNSIDRISAPIRRGPTTSPRATPGKRGLIAAATRRSAATRWASFLCSSGVTR